MCGKQINGYVVDMWMPKDKRSESPIYTAIILGWFAHYHSMDVFVGIGCSLMLMMADDVKRTLDGDDNAMCVSIL